LDLDVCFLALHSFMKRKFNIQYCSSYNLPLTINESNITTPFELSEMVAHDIIIQNQASHVQDFSIHGPGPWHDLKIAAGGEERIKVEDGSSGAILAIHDGKLCEQLEYTKAGESMTDLPRTALF
jgi:hypothetical protein